MSRKPYDEATLVSWAIEMWLAPVFTQRAYDAIAQSAVTPSAKAAAADMPAPVAHRPTPHTS
jgi:hypothetical protein